MFLKETKDGTLSLMEKFGWGLVFTYWRLHCIYILTLGENVNRAQVVKQSGKPFKVIFYATHSV